MTNHMSSSHPLLKEATGETGGREAEVSERSSPPWSTWSSKIQIQILIDIAQNRQQQMYVMCAAAADVVQTINKG